MATAKVKTMMVAVISDSQTVMDAQLLEGTPKAGMYCKHDNHVLRIEQLNNEPSQEWENRIGFLLKGNGKNITTGIDLTFTDIKPITDDISVTSEAKNKPGFFERLFGRGERR